METESRRAVVRTGGGGCAGYRSSSGAEENALEPEVVVAVNSDAVNVLSASESFTLKFYVNFHRN